jgi:hypothetical protein
MRFGCVRYTISRIGETLLRRKECIVEHQRSARSSRHAGYPNTTVPSVSRASPAFRRNSSENCTKGSTPIFSQNALNENVGERREESKWRYSISCMREDNASSSDGSELKRRVFVSVRESSCTMGHIGDGERLALALEGEVKKSVT